MAVSKSASATATTPMTWSHTINASGSDRILFVAVEYQYSVSAPTPTTTVTYNGVGMTLISYKGDSNSFEGAALYYLVAPATGTNTISVATSVSSGTFTHSGIASDYIGASQTGVPDSTANGSGVASGTTMPTTVVNSGCWLIAIASLGTGIASMGAGTTQRQLGNIAGVLVDSNGTVGTGSQQLVVNGGSTGGTAWIVASFKPSTTIALGPTTTDYTMTAGLGTYTYTGMAAGVGKLYTLVAAVGSYILTGIAAVFTFTGWSGQSKNSATWTAQSKNSAVWTAQSKGTLLIDSYSETNFSTNIGIQSAGNNIVGQTFAGISSTLSTFQPYLAKLGSPTGTMTAKLYATTGTFGTTSKPTGSALATSDSVTVSSVSSTQGLVTFTFSTPYTLTTGTKYAILIDGTSITGDASNLINWGQDTSSPTASGNKFTSTDGGTNYTTSSSVDMCFYIYGKTAWTAQAKKSG